MYKSLITRKLLSSNCKLKSDLAEDQAMGREVALLSSQIQSEEGEGVARQATDIDSIKEELLNNHEEKVQDPNKLLQEFSDVLMLIKKDLKIVGEMAGNESMILVTRLQLSLQDMQKQLEASHVLLVKANNRLEEKQLRLDELEPELEVEKKCVANMRMRLLKLEGDREVAREQCNKVEGHNTELRQNLKQLQEKVQQSETSVREALAKLLDVQQEQEEKASLLEELAVLKKEEMWSRSVHRREVQVLEEIIKEDLSHDKKLKAVVEMIIEDKAVLQTKLANAVLHVAQLKTELESVKKSSKRSNLKLQKKLVKQKAFNDGVTKASIKIRQVLENAEKLEIPVKCIKNQLKKFCNDKEAVGEELKLSKKVKIPTVSKELGIRHSLKRSLDRARILYQDRRSSLSTILAEEQVEPGLKLGPHLVRVTELLEEPAVWEAGEKRSSRRRTLARVEDNKEREDIQHHDWRELKEASSDRARKDLALRTFQNPVYSDPAKNLSFHGFRRQGNIHGLSTRIRKSEITEGRLIPISGGKRKNRDSLRDPQRSKVIRMSDFGRVMRSRFAEIFTERGDISQGGVENFTTFLKHHREGQDETTSFLTFYAGKKGAYLTEQQAWEVLEMEEVFSRIVQVCGEMEAVRCDTCGKNHKFSI